MPPRRVGRTVIILTSFPDNTPQNQKGRAHDSAAFLHSSFGFRHSASGGHPAFRSNGSTSGITFAPSV